MVRAKLKSNTMTQEDIIKELEAKIELYTKLKEKRRSLSVSGWYNTGINEGFIQCHDNTISDLSELLTKIKQQ